MTRTLYGAHLSRAPRCAWLLDELGLEFTVDEIQHRNGDTRTPQFLALNPNGKTPVLVDGHTVIWESMAVNLYLAMAYGRLPLWPEKVEMRGHILQWTIWAVTEVEPLLDALIMAIRKVGPLQEQQRAPAEINQRLARPLSVLDGELAKRQWLVGNEFSVADLNIASILSFSVFMKASDFSRWPNVRTWLEACCSRPAYARMGWPLGGGDA